MTKLNPIHFGILGIGIAMMFTVGIGTNLFQSASAGPPPPIMDDGTFCFKVGGLYDHWDKIIFHTTKNLLHPAEPKIIADQPYDIKVLDDPFTVADLRLKTAEFLNSIGYAQKSGFIVTPKLIIIDDVEYSNHCVILPLL